MASVVNDPNGRKRILFVDAEENRKAIRLGKIDLKSAETICRHIEALLAAKLGAQPVLSSILAVVLWQAWHMPTAKRFAQRCKGAACGRQRSTNGWATPGKCWKMRYGWGMFPRTLGSTF